MNFLKKQHNVILLVLAFVLIMQVVLAFRMLRLIKTVEAYELSNVSEYAEQAEVTPVYTPLPEPTVIPPRIDCPLDDHTQQMILEKCSEYDIDFAFTMAVIFKESSFRTDADSGSSVGLMQINRINHAWLSKELGITDFWDPEQNVEAGLYILRLLFDKYDDPSQVLMAYNMGETGAGSLWEKGIYTSDYAEGVLQQAEIYEKEIEERMGENAV